MPYREQIPPPILRGAEQWCEFEANSTERARGQECPADDAGGEENEQDDERDGARPGCRMTT
jgi:hypothetical protein